MANTNRCLIVFAKEPEKGRVKTRLSKHLGEEKVLELYKAFLRDVLDIARSVKSKYKILAYDSNSKNPDYIRKISHGFKLYRQKGCDLGEKMDDAFFYAQNLGCSNIVIIGSDSPTLPGFFIEEAFDRLKDHDITIGPSKDGGYYLIGVREASPDLFKGVKWGSKHVLKSTSKNAEMLYKKIWLLAPWYDVDTSRELELLENELKIEKGKIAKFTRKALGL